MKTIYIVGSVYCLRQVFVCRIHPRSIYLTVFATSISEELCVYFIFFSLRSFYSIHYHLQAVRRQKLGGAAWQYHDEASFQSPFPLYLD